MRIASVENENGVSSLINTRFDKKEVVVDKIDSIEELIFSDLSKYDLILVDMSHNMCLQAIQFIKQESNIPVIYLTQEYKKNPFEADIDDEEFVIHSYTREEFTNRIIRKVNELRSANIISLGFCTLDKDNGVFRIGNNILDLTTSEIEVCAILIEHMGEVLSKDYIADEMADRGIKTTARSVREYIRKIRNEFKKADINPIKTINRQGYKWVIEKCENIL
ncbi:MAG: winged helix-turn-helix domain-containing protein [Anaerococcus sp.]|nr:winged helix-turn-helix domain-containing protein [Anaerococcus sp.]